MLGLVNTEQKQKRKRHLKIRGKIKDKNDKTVQSLLSFLLLFGVHKL